MKNPEVFGIFVAMAGIYVGMLLLSIGVHIRLQRLFPSFSKTSWLLCGTIVLMCLVTSIKYSLDAWGDSPTIQILANDVLWTVRTWLLISSFTLHLLFWGQLYEQSVEELVLLTQTHITPKLKIILYIYIALIGCDSMVIIMVDYICAPPVAQEIAFIAYVSNYFSLILVTAMFLIYLYSNRSTSRQHPHHKKALNTVSLLALLCLSMFVLRAILDLTILNNATIVILFLYWILVEVIPITLVLIGFLRLQPQIELQPLLT